jgi:hypothetical protein
MSHPWLVIFALIALGVVYLLVPAIASVFFSYRRPLSLSCPETKTSATVGIAAWRAALTQFLGAPRLLVKRCSFWPGRSGCKQQCLAEFERKGSSPKRVT